MADRVILETGKTFSEFSLLTNYTSKDCTLQKINLKTNLGKLKLNLPFLSGGIPFNDALFATAFAAFVGCVVMGLLNFISSYCNSNKSGTFW